MKKIMFLIVLGILSGCAATGQQFSIMDLGVNNSDAVIYLYRPSRFANSAGYPKITLDGENKGGLKNGGYLVFRVSPGSHTITQEYSWTWDFKANPVVVNAKKNSQYFVRLDTGVHIGDPSAVVNGVSRYISFEEVEESVGLVEIKDLHISN